MIRSIRTTFLVLTALWLTLLSSSAYAGLGMPSVMTFTKAFGVSNIALNGSTSLTFNLALDNSGGGNTGAMGFTDALPAGLVVASPSGLSAATCAVGGGTITASAGSSTVSLAGFNLPSGGSCSFSVNVTGTTPGVKSNSVTTTAANIVGSTKTATASLTVLAAPVIAPVVPPPIPALSGLPPVTGIVNVPTLLDLTAGSGPTMTACLMNAVRTLLGADAVYMGQTANGVARIAQGGRVIAFYALAANTTSGPPIGFVLGNSNAFTLVTSCGTFTIAPAMSNLGDFGNYLTASGLSAQFNAQGVMTITVGSTVYVVRPDFITIPGTAPAKPSLLLGSDGLYRFTDSTGAVQVLRPAFLDTDGLSAQFGLAMGGTSTIQLDGTSLFTLISGQTLVLTPDYFLSPVPSANAAKLFWQDASNHYQFRSNIITLSQGTTAK